ncbi:MAG: hypothetical protein ACP5QO_08680 [Clostridia bacterium]
MSGAFARLAPTGVAAAVDFQNGDPLRPVAEWPPGVPGESHAWLVLGVAHGRVPTLWRVLDFDNKHGEEPVGSRIAGVVDSLLAHFAGEGTRAFYLPSKSGWEQPVGHAGHLFAWLPELTPAGQEQRLVEGLERVLGRHPAALSAYERARVGLDPDLRIFFPPDDDVGAALSLTPVVKLYDFRRAWVRFSRLD